MNFLRLTAALTAALVLAACGIDQNELSAGGDDELSDTQDALVNKGRFETFTGKDSKTYFHLLAGNGEKVLQSQGYATAAAAADGIASVKANGVDAARYLNRETSDGAAYFVLTAKNGAIIGMSETYASASNATRAITSVVNVIKTTVEEAPAAPTARFETFKGLSGKYYFHARAGNGEIVLQSQPYTTHASAKNGVASVQTNGSIAARYEVRAAADGQYYFVLRAANGAVVGRGELYVSKSNAERGVATCVELLTAQLAR
jgi:uncharacterized protein YegP (UPF0339 family)